MRNDREGDGQVLKLLVNSYNSGTAGKNKYERVRKSFQIRNPA